MSTYSLFLDHNAPFNYYPYGDPYSSPDLRAGWAPWNDVSGAYDPNRNQSDVSEGRTSRRTQQDNASVELYFSGSSITLLGDVDSCGLEIWLDGASSPASPGNGELAEFSGLDNKEHRVLMTVHPFGNGSISFSGAQVDVSVENASPASLGEANVPVDFGNDWTYQPSAASNTALGDYYETTKLGASINVTLHQTSAVTVYGIRSLDAGKYIVSLDNALPSTRIAKSSFQSRSILYFAAGLDPTVDHHLVLTNVEEGSHFAISSINATTVNTHGNANGSEAFSVPKGTLIALITAVAAAVIILLVIGACFLIRRRRTKARRLARLREFSVVPREYSPKNPSFTMNDDTVTKSRHDQVILVTSSHGHSYGSLHRSEEHDLEADDEEDGSFQFVRRPLLSTPSLRMPNLGDTFHVDFPSARSDDHHSRRSSRRSTAHASEHSHHEQPMNRDTSDQTNFLHLQESSGSTDAHSNAEKHRSRVRFSTPPLFVQIFKHPFAWVGDQGSRSTGRNYQRSSRSTLPNEPNTPLTAESIPFTVGTSVAFEHPDSTPSNSLEASRGESTSETRDIEEGPATGGTNPEGFIPHSARPWRVSG